MQAVVYANIWDAIWIEISKRVQVLNNFRLFSSSIIWISKQSSDIERKKKYKEREREYKQWKKTNKILISVHCKRINHSQYTIGLCMCALCARIVCVCAISKLIFMQLSISFGNFCFEFINFNSINFNGMLSVECMSTWLCIFDWAYLYREPE